MRSLFALLLLTLCLIACAADPLRDLDLRTARAIREAQTQSLGPGHGYDPQPVPARAGLLTARDGAYNRRPSTVNPLASDLPARPSVGDEPAGAVTAPLETAGAQRLGLPDVLAFAVEHAPEYRREKEELFLSALDLLREKHLWGPRFFATFGSEVRGTPEAGDHDQVLDLFSRLSVSQRLPYGGSVSAGALANYVNQLRSASDTEDPDTQDAAIDASITLPLLRGAGRVAQEDLIQAERNLIYAAREFERFRRQFLVDVSTRYFDLLRGLNEIGNLERQLANFQWLSARINALAKAGREPLFEVQRAQQQELFAANNLSNRRESFAADLDRFKILIGMPIEQQLVLDRSVIDVPDLELDAQAAVRVAQQYRLDLQTRRDQVADAHRRMAIARNNLLPDLDFNASVALPTDSDKDIAGVDLSTGDGSYSAGLTLSSELDQQTERIDHRRAVIGYEQARRDYEVNLDEVASEVRSSIRQIARARFTLENQNINITLAEKRLRGVLLRLRTLGPRDFIEAQEDLLEARTRRDEAERDLRVSILNYLLSTGQMRIDPQGGWRPPALIADEVRIRPMPAPDDLIREGDDLGGLPGEPDNAPIPEE